MAKPSVTYRRIPHAGHYGHSHPAKGHDLEQWDVKSELRPELARVAIDVPRDAEYDCGYLDLGGHQHWLYTRKAPLSPGGCTRCAPANEAQKES